MTGPDSTLAAAPKPDLFRLGMAHFFQALVTFSLLGCTLFLSAGRLDWLEAWVILLIYFAIALAAGLWMLRYDPVLLRERHQAILKTNVKKWDRVMVLFNLVLTLALFAVIGLDRGRFGWSSVPVWVRIFGGLAIFLSFGISLWAASVNTWLSAMVRIQGERGHQAITVGPYRYVRHPMYLGMCLLDTGLPLLFGSWLGLAVSGLMILMVGIRTTLEDKTLQRELQGYADYVRQVHYRLVPGIW